MSPPAFDLPQRLDALQVAKRLESRFFKAGTYDPVEAAGLVVVEALSSGAVHVRVSRSGEWYMVAGDPDWIPGEDVFRRFVPAADVNSAYVGVVLAAVARSVFTACHGDRALIALNDRAGRDWAAVPLPDAARVIAFR